MKEMPKDLPPLPEGYVYLGLGGEFVSPDEGSQMIGFNHIVQKWSTLKLLYGAASELHYAAPKGSEIAKLNGYGEEEKKPEPISDGGPAFPMPDTHHANGRVQYGSNGMTLRDWFAGQALASTGCGYGAGHEEQTARVAYAIADAMLKARNKQEPQS